MSRVPWRVGKVISIETRDGIFVLAQMIQDPYIVFFNVFNDSHNWPSTELESIPVLYIAGVTRQFVSKSNVKYLKHIDAVTVDQPKAWIHPNQDFVYRTIWTELPIELTVCYYGDHGGSLIERDITAPDFASFNNSERVIVEVLPSGNFDAIEGYELTTLRTFPHENERLYLCYLFKKNVDPEKELMFDLPLPHEYHRYMSMSEVPPDVLESVKEIVRVDPLGSV